MSTIEALAPLLSGRYLWSVFEHATSGSRRLVTRRADQPLRFPGPGWVLINTVPHQPGWGRTDILIATGFED